MTAALQDGEAHMPILATLDTHEAHARRHAPGGELNATDRSGIFRRVATIHGVTPQDVADAVDWRRAMIKHLSKLPARAAITRGIE